MPTTSTQPAAKAALVTLLVDAGLPATYGTPAKAPSDEWVRVGRVQGTQTAAVFAGSLQPRDEDYEITMTVRVRMSGDGQQLATERAYVLAGQIEEALRADPTLGGVVHWALVSAFDLEEEAPDGSSRLADLDVTVTCRARVQGA